MKLLRIVVVSVLTAAGVAAVIAIPRAAQTPSGPFERVLLLSIDGMHASDLDWYVANRPNSTLAQLSATGRTYTNASATKPSDSFPGMLAMVTGGTPRSTQVYYDDSYDRSLVAGLADGNLPVCELILSTGIEVVWKQNLDIVPVLAPFITSVDETRLPVDPILCARVHPNQFPRGTINNVFEIIRNAGGHAAWSDKHPAYEFLKGPSGLGPDDLDLFTPEIASCAGTLPCGSSNPLLTTNSFSKTMAYDDMKVTAILNEIKGYDHTGINPVGVPTLFGMNFQAVSVGQKLRAEPLSGTPILVGGYVVSGDTVEPASGLLAALDHTDQSIGSMVAELRNQKLLDGTMIIISAKHGNMRIDPNAAPGSPFGLTRVSDKTIVGTSTAPGILDNVAPVALVSQDTGPVIWLKNPELVSAAVAELNKPANRALLNLAQLPADAGPDDHPGILAGQNLAALYRDGDNDSLADVRIPDIILVPQPGTLYSLTPSKISDHGSFNDDDVHVALLVSNPGIVRQTISTAVETRQIACTILDALGRSCALLKSEAIDFESSTALPYDSTPPVLTLPLNIMTNAHTLSGAVVDYSATAVDQVDGPVPVLCNPPSHSTFVIGTTTVNCTATDAAGNVANGSFDVVVLATPETMLQQLVLDNNLHQAQNLLQSTINALDRKNINATCGKLGAFINQVQAQSGKTLMPADADALIGQAADVTAALGCK